MSRRAREREAEAVPLSHVLATPSRWKLSPPPHGWKDTPDEIAP